MFVSAFRRCLDGWAVKEEPIEGEGALKGRATFSHDGAYIDIDRFHAKDDVDDVRFLIRPAP